MSTWTKQKLGDVLEVSTGYPFKSNTFVASGEYGLVTIRNVQENRFDGSCDSRIDAIPDNVPKFCFLNEGDILLSLTGNVGRVCRVADGKYLLNQRVAKLSPKEGNNPNFLFSYLRQPAFRHRLENISNGVAQMNLSPIELENIELSVPDLPTQTRIASVLSAYDDLIENNEKRIKALEEMAQLLYTEWFVKFKFPGHEKVKLIDSGTVYGKIPEGWEVKNVESLIKRIPVGKKYENKNVFETGKVPVLDQGKSGFIGFHNDEPGVQASIENPVIVFANHTCYQNIIVYPFSAIQNVLPFIPNDDRSIVWLHWATKDLIKFNDYKGHWPEFMAKKLIVPTTDLTKKFGSLVGEYVAMRYKLQKENQTLSKTRDLLIPQLVTGRRELKNI